MGIKEKYVKYIDLRKHLKAITIDGVKALLRGELLLPTTERRKWYILAITKTLNERPEVIIWTYDQPNNLYTLTIKGEYRGLYTRCEKTRQDIIFRALGF